VGPRAGLDKFGKSRPHRDSIPGPSSPYPVAIPTELPDRRKINAFSKLHPYKINCFRICHGNMLELSAHRGADTTGMYGRIQRMTSDMPRNKGILSSNNNKFF